jgi:5-formyltetrahydrofolate cyclo-ligase
VKDKKSIRKDIQLLLERISTEDRKVWERKLLERASQMMSSYSGFWGIYNALPLEPQLNKLLSLCPQIRWCYPRVEVESGLKFYEVGQNGEWLLGNFKNLKEPDPKTSKLIKLEEMQGCLVPGLAFDRRGYRLGWGKGYYDRTFANFKGVKVGVLFSLQILESDLPNETHDICMDFLLTENGIIRPQK